MGPAKVFSSPGPAVALDVPGYWWYFLRPKSNSLYVIRNDIQ